MKVNKRELFKMTNNEVLIFNGLFMGKRLMHFSSDNKEASINPLCPTCPNSKNATNQK